MAASSEPSTTDHAKMSDLVSHQVLRTNIYFGRFITTYEHHVQCLHHVLVISVRYG